MAEDVLLSVSDVTLRFGGVVSLDRVSLELRRGEILAVIGPNGAGKTSLFNSLTGVYRPQLGSIMLRRDGQREPVDLVGLSPADVNHLGVARTFQNIRLFPALTTMENVKVALETRQRSGAVSAMLGLPWQRREERQSTADALHLLEEVGLPTKANDLAGALAYGEQRRLEIARALGTGPAILLLDEPAAGTNPAEKRDLSGLIRRINRERGTTVLLIEHDMKLVMSLADRVAVLNFGQKLAEGLPTEIQQNPAVIAAYLGQAEESRS